MIANRIRKKFKNTPLKKSSSSRNRKEEEKKKWNWLNEGRMNETLGVNCS